MASKNHAFLGTFPQKDVGNLAVELDRQQKARRDFIFPATALAMTAAGALVFKSLDTFKVGNMTYTDYAEAESAAEAHKAAMGEYLPIEPLGKSGDLPISDTAESQLSSRLGIPIRYVRSLREDGHGDLAATNFSTLLERDKRRFLVRTLDGTVRAVLSNRYRCLDNGDLFYHAADTFKAASADLWTARLWGDGFQMLGVSPGIRGQVTTDRTFDPGDGWRSRWYNADGGDVHFAAVSINNSETGRGGLDVEPAIMRRVCANFCVWGDTFGLIHIGRKLESDGLLKHLGLGDVENAESGGSLITDATRRAEDNVTWMKIRDVISGAFNAERFKAHIDALNNATAVEITKPEKAVENVALEYSLSDDRRSQILAELLGSGDRSKYGLIQAVTFSAHKADAEGAPDQAETLEGIGADILDMPDAEFSVLAERNPAARRKRDKELAAV